MRNYIQPGHAITLAAPYDVVSGAGLLVGSIFGVASQRRALRRRGRDPAHRRHRPRQGREPGLDRRRQGLLGQHRQARHQRRLGQHADRRCGARRRRRRRRARRPGAAQRRLLSDDRLRRPRRPAVCRSEPRAGRDLGAGGRGADPVRVVARQADAVTEFGGGRLWSETTRFDLRVAEVANPRPGDRIVVAGEAFVVQGEPVRDRERLVWTLDVRPA